MADEERLLTLYVVYLCFNSTVELRRLVHRYADVHYYFDAPSPRPLHHRFDKGSYVYLYRDAVRKRGRLEIANHAGQPEQDAFTGCELSRPPPLVNCLSANIWKTSIPLS